MVKNLDKTLSLTLQIYNNIDLLKGTTPILLQIVSFMTFRLSVRMDGRDERIRRQKSQNVAKKSEFRRCCLRCVR